VEGGQPVHSGGKKKGPPFQQAYPSLVGKREDSRDCANAGKKELKNGVKDEPHTKDAAEAKEVRKTPQNLNATGGKKQREASFHTIDYLKKEP